jgi:hypothetical protein
LACCTRGAPLTDIIQRYLRRIGTRSSITGQMRTGAKTQSLKMWSLRQKRRRAMERTCSTTTCGSACHMLMLKRHMPLCFCQLARHKLAARPAVPSCCNLLRLNSSSVTCAAPRH